MTSSLFPDGPPADVPDWMREFFEWLAAPPRLRYYDYSRDKLYYAEKVENSEQHAS